MARMSTDVPHLRFDPGPPLATVGAAPPPTPVTTPTTPTPAPPPAPANAGQPDLEAVKAEFIPGDKTLFFDDFSDMSADDAPAQGGDVRQLTINSRDVTLTPNLAGLPKNLTMETVLKINGHGAGLSWMFRKKAPPEAMSLRLEAVYTRSSRSTRISSPSKTQLAGEVGGLPGCPLRRIRA
jgi:hypothetical protein